tara:strand:- start:629 stop:976 length:348 start_codon:yes stop_codon:yes gene_type:complete
MLESNLIEYLDFENVDIRLGTIIKAEKYSKLKFPSMKLEIDFGDKIGIKKSSAQILKNYDHTKIVGKQIAAVINFKPKQIGKIISEVLVLGFPDQDGDPILISPDKKLQNGIKLF